MKIIYKGADMKLSIAMIILIFATAASSCGFESPVGDSSSRTITDWQRVVPESKDFVFTGIGYQQNHGVMYSDPSGGHLYYVDPVNGSAQGDGSISNPWKTLQQVIEDGLVETWNRPVGDPLRESIARNSGAPVNAGDILILKTGNHGTVYIRESFNNSFITIRTAVGEKPLIRTLRFTSAGNWRVDGLYITQEMNFKEFVNISLIRVESYWGRSRNIEFYNNIVYSMWNTSKWSKADWNELSCNGLDLDGDYCIIENNYFRNINFGISIGGEHNDTVNNTVKNFSGDGMRGNGNYLLFEKNFVKNCYAVNANHDDGFQSFCVNGITEWNNITLRKNVILNYENSAQPFRGSLQGIGCFDGFFRNWSVENNIVITDHWHGITFMGMTDSIISNNIVVDINSVSPGPSWILLSPHKDGRLSENCLVNNNITHQLSISTPNNNITESGNTIITLEQRNDIFNNPANLDFTLKPAYEAILQ